MQPLPQKKLKIEETQTPNLVETESQIAILVIKSAEAFFTQTLGNHIWLSLSNLDPIFNLLDRDSCFNLNLKDIQINENLFKGLQEVSDNLHIILGSFPFPHLE